MKNPLLFLILLLNGCIQAELPGSEADITEFALPNVDLLDVNIDKNSVYIVIDEKYIDSIKNIAPIIEISKGAKITPALGTRVNLTQDAYTLTSENGKYQKIYTIKIGKGYNADTLRFHFDDWQKPNGYYQPSDNNWSSGNGGISIALGLLGRADSVPENYPSQMTTQGKSGSAVKLVTTEGGMITLMRMNVAVWAGSFFLGNFNTNRIATPLLATEFGRICKRIPKILRGYYKYTEGTGDYVYSFSKGDENRYTDSRRDTCAIYAVFYLSDGITLDATNIDNHPNIISRADIAYHPEYENGATTSGDDFREFTLNFIDKTNAPAVDFGSHTYKLAIVFSSSAGGGVPKQDDPTTTVYAGKIGSTLIVDEVEVINEK